MVEKSIKIRGLFQEAQKLGERCLTKKKKKEAAEKRKEAVFFEKKTKTRPSR